MIKEHLAPQSECLDFLISSISWHEVAVAGGVPLRVTGPSIDQPANRSID
jgi:hypothetical protein